MSLTATTQSPNPASATPRPARTPSLARRALDKFVIVAYRRPLRMLAEGLNRLALRTFVAASGTYQPISIGRVAVSRTDAGRQCEERWQLIHAHLDSDYRLALDLGCGEGYFAFKLAEAGVTAIGIDNLQEALFVALQKSLLDRPRNVAFLRADLTPELVRDHLPSVDVVVCLSVLHHLMHYHGEAWCARFLREVRGRTRRALFLEMGQSDEYTDRGSRTLPDMGSNPHQWIADFIRAQGFSRVEKLGTTMVDAHQTRHIRRALFKATP